MTGVGTAGDLNRASKARDTLPVPTIDHLVVNVRDRIDAGAEAYRRLGFTLTPRGYHTLGSMNHLAIFGTDYLELIAAPPGDTRRREILEAPEGLNGLVFASEDADATHAAAAGAGVRIDPVQQFSRPVDMPGGARDAAFRTTRLPNDTTPAGRLYFCQHLTRDLVWRDEWRHHPNGTVGVARMVIAAADPGRLGGLFRRMFGEGAVRGIDGGCALTLGLARCDIVTPARLAALFGDAAPDGGGRDEYMAALTLRTRGLDQALAALQAGGVSGVRHEGSRIVVPAGQAFGATIEFTDG
jgi:hypothetical protein